MTFAQQLAYLITAEDQNHEGSGEDQMTEENDELQGTQEVVQEDLDHRIRLILSVQGSQRMEEVEPKTAAC